MNSLQLLSIIIPVLNEQELLPRLLDSLAPLSSELLVVDGGSSDATLQLARNAGATVLDSCKGRGRQLRVGASAASGDLLLFLHADSMVTPAAIETIRQSLANPSFQIGLFRLLFDQDRAIYRLYSFFSRFNSVWTNFGDQGILVSRALYEKVGGFPDQSLLEDVAFLRAVRSCAHIEKFSAGIITSARRFEQNGPVRTQWQNLFFMLRYLLGADPEALAREYQG